MLVSILGKAGANPCPSPTRKWTMACSHSRRVNEIFTLDKLLLPTDFSPRAAFTARAAVGLAERFGSRLILLHAVPPMDRSIPVLESGGALLDEVMEFQMLRARNQLEEFAERHLHECEVDCQLWEGDPASLIVEHAEAAKVDLIMMPSSGCGPFRRFILGSVTAKVLHDSGRPVWTGVHVEEMPAVRSTALNTILCAVDQGPESERVLGWASALAARAGAALIVAHAIPSLGYNPETYYIEADMRRFLVGQAREKIAAMLQGGPAPDARIVVQGGSVPRVVRAAAEDCQADLAIIGRASSGGLFGRLRTNSYAIIRESPCPVVSV